MDIVEKILSHGKKVEVDKLNRMGDTPLHLAALKGSKGCIELLRKTERVDVMKPNAKDQIAFYLASDADAQKALKLWINENKNENENGNGDYGNSDDDEEEDSS